MSIKKSSLYKSKTANIKHAESLISMGEKLIYGIFAVPISYLMHPEMELEWVSQYIFISAFLVIGIITMQHKGYQILEETTSE